MRADDFLDGDTSPTSADAFLDGADAAPLPKAKPPTSLKDQFYAVMNRLFRNDGSVMDGVTQPTGRPFDPVATAALDRAIATPRAHALPDALPAVGVIEKGVRGGVAQLGKGGIGMLQGAADTAGLDTISDVARAAAARANQFAANPLDKQRIEGFTPDSIVQDLPDASAGAITSVISNLPALAASVVAPGAGLPVMFGQAGAAEYADGRAAGLNAPGALLRALPMAAAEVVGEKVGGFNAVSKGVRSAIDEGSVVPLARSMVKSGVREMPGEELTTGLQFGIDKLPGIGTNQEATGVDLARQMKDTALQTVLQSAGMVGAGAALNAAGQPKAVPPRVETAPPVDIADLTRAIAETATIDSRLQPKPSADAFLDDLDQAARANPPTTTGTDADFVGRAEVPVNQGAENAPPAATTKDVPRQPVLAEPVTQPETTNAQSVPRPAADPAHAVEPAAADVAGAVPAAPVVRPNPQAMQQPAETDRPAPAEPAFQSPLKLDAQQAQQIEAATEGLRPGDIIAASGKPFTSKTNARRAAKNAGPGWTTKRSGGGFVVRYQPPTEKQTATAKKLAKSQAQIDVAHDSLFAAIAKLGGIRLDDLTKQWGFDPAEFKNLRGAGIRRVGTANGRSLDSMAEALAELGYLAYDENGQHDLGELFDLFDGELRGNKHYAPEGFERQAQAQRDAEYDEWQARQDGLSDADIEASGWNELPDDGHDAIEEALDEYDAQEASPTDLEGWQPSQAESAPVLDRADGQVGDDARAEEGNDRRPDQAAQGAPDQRGAAARAADAAQSAGLDDDIAFDEGDARLQPDDPLGDVPFSRTGAEKAPQSLQEVRAAWDAEGIENFISERGDTINLSKIVVPQEARNSGAGTRAMQALIAYADSSQKRITLTPSSDFGGSKDRLIGFYKQFGFVQNKGRHRDLSTMEAMYRDPFGVNLSRQPGAGQTVDAVRSAIASDIYGHDVDVLASLDEAPDYVRDQAEREGATDIEGYWDPRKNKVVLIANNLASPERAREVARHELIGHYGLENMVGRDDMALLAMRVIRAEKDGNKVIAELAQQVDRTQPGLSPQRRAKEIIAVMAERNIQNSITKRVIDAIRAFLKQIGFVKSDITDAEIAALLRDAQAYLRTQGREMVAGEAAAAFARGEQAPTALESGTPLTRADVLAKQEAEAKAKKAEDRPLLPPVEKDVTADQVDMFNPQGSLFSATAEQRDTIEVDGIARPTMNSEGKPIGYTSAGLRDFWRFYGDGPVDAAGRPVVKDGRYVNDQGVTKSVDNIGTWNPNDARIMYSRTDTAQSMRELAELAKQDGNANRTVQIGEVQPWEADAAKKVGLTIDGYRHTADVYAVRHVIKKHGDPAAEAARNQIAITEDDIAALPDVVMHPDAVILGIKNARGQDQVFSVKAMADGTMLVAEEVRTGRESLALVSVRKVPGAKNAKELLPSVLLNVRNDAGKAIVVDAPDGFNEALMSRNGHQEALDLDARDPFTAHDLTATVRDVSGRRQWAAGAKAYDKLGRAIEPLLAKVKLSNDAPVAFKQMMRQFQVDQQRALANARRVAETGIATLSTEERVLISDIIEKNAIGDLPPEHVAKLANDIGAALKQQAQELVDLGMASEDRLLENYLPRAYRNPLLARITSKEQFVSWYQKAKLRMNGNRLKSRGLVNKVAINDIDKFKALGWKLSAMADGDPIPADLLDALDAGRALPPQYATKDMKILMWRDFTADERAKMGEIRDGLLRYALGYTETQRDIAIGRLFKAIAEHDELSSKTNPGGWTKVPDQAIPGTELKRYGALSGLYVPPYVRDVIERSTQPKGPLMQMYDKALSFWKEGKTVWNPVSHGNNVVSNVFTMYFAGLNPARAKHWRQTMREYRTKGQYYQEAVDHGLFGTEFASKEIQELFLPDLTDDLDVEAVVASRLNKVVESLKKTGKPVGWYRERMQQAYEFEDQFFKLMLFIDRRQAGASIDDAIVDTERYIFNYSDIPEGVEFLKRGYSPFFSYTYKALPMVVHTAMTRPDRLLLPIMLLSGANWLFYALMGGDEDEDRRGMPEYMQGRTAIGTPKAVRMPFNIGDRPAFMDMSRRVPLGDLFDMTNQTGGLPVPAPFMPSHPLLTATAALMFNVDTFTGKPVVQKSDTAWEVAGKRADWIFKQIAPNAPFVPGSWNFDKLMNGAANAFDTEMAGYTGYTKAGDATPLAIALLDVAGGTKIRSFDPERGVDFKTSALDKERREIQANIRSALRNKSMTAGARAEYVAEQRDKLKRLQEQRAELQ